MFGDGKLVHLPGGIDEYLERGHSLSVTPTAPGRTETAPAAGARAEAKVSAAETRAAQKELARLERTLARLDDKAAKLHVEMAEQATDYVKISELDEQLKAVAAEREQTEEAWLVAAEAAEG